MHFRLFFFLLLTSCRPETSTSELDCTMSCASQGERVYVAKTFDWVSDHGTLFLNPAGIKKEAVFLRQRMREWMGVVARALLKVPQGELTPAKWTSRFASLSFNQAGSLFPIGGINERGLVVEALTHNGMNIVPEDAGTKPSVNEWQWVAMQLDLYANVADVTQHAADVHIVFDTAPMHFMVCDATSACVMIEYASSRELLITAVNDPAQKILTNHLLREALAHTQTSTLRFASANEGGDASLDRFVIAQSKLDELRLTGEPLSKERVMERLVDPVWVQDLTQWGIVYDVTQLSLAFKTQSDRDPRSVDVAPLIKDRHCREQSFAFRGLGERGPDFVALGSDEERALVKEGIDKILWKYIKIGAVRGKAKDVRHQLIELALDSGVERYHCEDQRE